jgi:hypothetical protein
MTHPFAFSRYTRTLSRVTPLARFLLVRVVEVICRRGQIEETYCQCDSNPIRSAPCVMIPGRRRPFCSQLTL